MLLLLVGGGCAMAAQGGYDFSLPEQSLADSLRAVGSRAGVNIVFDPASVQDKRAPLLQGSYSVPEALQRLLQGSGLRIRTTEGGSFLVEGARQSSATESSWSGIRLAQAKSSAAAASGEAASDEVDSSNKLEEIVVTGSYTRRSANSATGLNMTLRETPQSVTVISHERMEDQNLTEISDVLTQAVGISYDGSTLGSDSPAYYSRGFSVTNYQVNGVPRPAGIYGFDLTTSDMISYDRVEIVRGATGLMNGVGNPSASINLIRKRPKKQLAGATSMQGGSWSQYRLAAELGGPLTESGRVRGLLAASYQEGDSYIDRINMRKKALYGILEADLSSSTTVSLGVEYQSFRNLEAPRGSLPLFYTDGTATAFPRSTNSSASWSDLANSKTYLFGSLEHSFSPSWLIKLDAEHAEPDYDDTMGYLGEWVPFATDGTGAQLYSARWASKLKQDFVSAYTQGSFDWWGRKHDLVFGVSYIMSKQNGANYCGWWCGGDFAQSIDNAFEFFAGRSNLAQPGFSPSGGRTGGYIEQSSAYTALRLRPAEKLAVIFGGRWSNWRQRQWDQPEGGSRQFVSDNEEKGVVTPYVGAIFELTRNLSAYASFTQIFQPQAYFFQDINGNLLEPLEGTNKEAGVKAEFFEKRLAVSFGVFRVEQDNLPIWLGPNGPNGQDAYRPESGTLSKGFELEVAGELLPGWQLVGGYSRADAKAADGSPLLSYIPEEQFKVFSSYQLPGSLKRLTLGANVRWEGDSSSAAVNINGEPYRQSGLVVVDLMAKYALFNRAILQLNANNVLDEEYYNGLAGGASYGAPRNVTVAFKYAF